MTPSHKKWSFYDSFDNENDLRLARALSIIILIYLIGSLILIVVDTYWGDSSLYGILILGGLFQLLPLFFLVKGNLSACSFTATGTYILSATLFATTGAGIRDYVIMIYPAVIMFAGLTEKRRGLITSTLLSITALTWLVLGERWGWFEPLKPTPPNLLDLFIIILLILISAIAVGLLIEHLEYAHTQTKRELGKRIRAEENLQALIENIDGSIWSVDERYRLIVGNSHFQQSTKVARGRDFTSGENVLSDFPKNTADEWQGYYDRALQGERFNIQLSTKFTLKPHDVEYNFSPIRDQDGKVSGVTVFGRDITERLQMERLLHDSEEQNRAIIDSVPDLMFRLQRDGTITDYHAPKDSSLLVPPKEFLNHILEDVLPPTVAASAREAIKRALITNQMVMFDYEMEIKGETRYYEDRIVPINSEEVLSVIRDITERRRAEMQLSESEERFRRLADNAPDIIFRYNLIPEMRLNYINPAVQSITGYTPEECYADPFLMLNMAHPDDAWIMAEHLQALNTPGNPLFMRWIGKDGQTRWMESRIVPIFSSDGKLMAVEGITRDITERKHAEERLRESEELLRNINNNLVSGMVYQVLRLKDGSRKFTYLSDSVQRLYGISPQQGIENPNLIYGRVHQEDMDYILHEEEKANQTLSVFKAVVRMINPDGSIRWSSFVSNPTQWEDGTTCWNGIELDITERQIIENALRESELKYRTVADNTRDWEFWQAPNGEFIYTSPSCIHITGRSADEFTNQMHLLEEIIHPDDLLVFQTHQNHITTEKTVEEIEFRIIRPDRSIVWINHICQPVFDDHGNYLGARGSNRDITRRKQMDIALEQAHTQMHNHIFEIEKLHEELRIQAMHDSLTNLYNRRYLSEALERELKRAKRERKSVSIIIMDLDRFKRINDTYGHQVGDKFLKAIADLLKTHTRGSDIACRYGGEEFLLVLPGTDKKDAYLRAEQLRLECQKIRIPHENKELLITISMGVATFPTHAKITDDLLVKADKALYTSKHSGRNTVSIWNE
jgi:diguanylate cyclase (GGDEF)-like protein/PAS domain S-box-containing protein